MAHSQNTGADLILFNGRVTTLGTPHPEVSALAVREGKFLAVGSDGEVLALRGPDTKVIDLGGRRAVPGLNDSHLHLIRGGLNYTLELRWEGCRRWPSPCRCSESRRPAFRPRRGSGSSAGGVSPSSPSGGCPPSTRSTRSAPTPPSSSSTCTTAPS